VGIRAGVLALIVKTFWGMFKKCKKSGFVYALMITVFACVVFWDVSVVLLLLLCAMAGLCVKLWTGREKK
jgi:chromate transport protein ChrA